MTSIKSKRDFIVTSAASAFWLMILGAVLSFAATRADYVAAMGADYGDQSTKALVAKLKESKISLVDGIRQSEKEQGSALSAKFELDQGVLSLSVYNAKEGRDKDAEHNVLTEAAGDATKAPWAPKVKVFEDKEHLTRATMHLTLVQTSKLGLADAVQRVSDLGTVYSATPTIVRNAAVFELLVATADGKSTKFLVNARTGRLTGEH